MTKFIAINELSKGCAHMKFQDVLSRECVNLYVSKGNRRQW